MKTPFLLTGLCFVLLPTACFSQVVIDGKNINDDKAIEYIQFSYFYESKKLNPVYSIDYGLVIPEGEEITRQKIVINDQPVTDKMTPMMIFNELFRAGWEYMGDAVFMATPMFENTQVFTFRRKK